MSRLETIEAILEFLVPLLGLIVFFFTGRAVERSHLRRLAIQEEALSHIMVHELKSLPQGWTVTGEPILVYGSVVLALDYYKSFMSGLKKIVGGRLGAYETLVDRGRREALVRMKQMAADHGCNVVWNMRMETSMMMNSRGGSSSTELYTYGTAMRVQNTYGA